MHDRNASGDMTTLTQTALRFFRDRLMELGGIAAMGLSLAMTLALFTYDPADPSFNNATGAAPHNLLGLWGSHYADIAMQVFGLGAMAMVPPVAVAGWWLMSKDGPGSYAARVLSWVGAVIFTSTLAATLPFSAPAPLATGLGGVAGDWVAGTIAWVISAVGLSDSGTLHFITGLLAAIATFLTLNFTMGLNINPFSWRLGDHPALDGHEEEDEDDYDEERGRGFGPLPFSRPAMGFANVSGWIGRLFGRRDDEADDTREAPWDPNLTPGNARVPVTRRTTRKEEPQTGAFIPPQRRQEAPAAKPSRLNEPEDQNWADDGEDDAPWEDEATSEAGSGGFSISQIVQANPLRALADKLAATKDQDQAPEEEDYDGDDDADMAAWEDSAEAPPMPEAASQPKTEDDKPKKSRAEVKRSKGRAPAGKKEKADRQGILPLDPKNYSLPPLTLLQEPSQEDLDDQATDEMLQANARQLETVLQDFGVKGEIIHVRPGPVVTLYELEPAPGIKSSRVIGLADDIARSMSAVSARVAVVPGRNVIGIELPNKRREMVFLRELLAAVSFEKSKARVALALGKDIGGEPVTVDLATMPHLLIAGTTGSGKSVAINTMILSLLYRLPPSECRLLMIDPKMLELSVYEGIPHLLSPVVTDPKKAVVALKWVVREMEDRYRKMSKLGVRNIRGYNDRVREAEKKGEVLTRQVQTGFDKETGEPIYEQEELSYDAMPFIVVVIDEMADLMMVAGKDIEAAVQRLAQMARAAGIHLLTATQRPSVDVITGTIKANFPTRISFQVTSKIDSRTVLGEQGAEQLLGQGDMLYMAGGGRIRRVHGPFVSDQEVEDVVAYLKDQGTPAYIESITEEQDDDPQSFLDMVAGGGDDSGDELYDRAVAIVARDRKASTSYIQRKLQIGYNRAARLIERMEEEGVISAANHVGKREVLVADHSGMDED